ncbi:hypothetical protein [Paractinoplanes globisporus]|uniref:Uncharacterized protein n=1 Tax=Paractinoplanes globisporus TaxID=113565 RepID=A0ABW6WMZ3_9ACTN|nr:hypothetical protein [Actinoplanes globisporus]
MSSTRRCAQPATRRPLLDDMPSGRLDSRTPTGSDTLTPPCSTVRPSTNDSGMPSRIEPSTIAIAEPPARAPSGSLRSPAPRRVSSQSPAAKTTAPTSTSRPTQAHRAGVQGRVDQLEGNRAEQYAAPQRHHDGHHPAARCQPKGDQQR